MSKIDEIRSAMVAAMKAGDKERKAALSFLLSSLKNKDLGIDAPTAKDKGKIMKELMPKVKGKADGKEVNQILAGMMK